MKLRLRIGRVISAYSEQQRISICYSKNRYASVDQAHRIIRARRKRDRIELFCYQCPICEGHHLTRQPQNPLLAPRSAAQP